MDTARGTKLSKEIALLSRHVNNKVRNKNTLEPGLDTLLNSESQLGHEESSEIKLTFMGNSENRFKEDDFENYQRYTDSLTLEGEDFKSKSREISIYDQKKQLFKKQVQ